jgi:hypothetical protein
MSASKNTPLWANGAQRSVYGQYVQFKDYGLDENITMPISVSKSGVKANETFITGDYTAQPTSYGYVNHHTSHGQSTSPSSIRLSSPGNSLSSLNSMNETMNGNLNGTMNDVPVRPGLSAVVTVPPTMKEWRKLLESCPLVILYIWKQSCVPCTNAGRKYEELARHYTMKYGIGNVLFVKDQIDGEHVQDETSPSFAHWRICEAVPFYMIYVNNKLFTSQTGFIQEDLCSAIESASSMCAPSKTNNLPYNQRNLQRHEESNVIFYTVDDS